MSPTVPPISTMTTSALELAAAWRMRALISSVTCGMTCTVAAEEVAPALLLDDRVVDRAGGDVRDAGEALVGEALVVAEVEVGLGAVLGHEDLAVLERAHRARVDVEVWIALLERHLHPARLEQGAQGRGGDALPEPGDDASGHEHVLHRSLDHVPSSARRPDEDSGRVGAHAPPRWAPTRRQPRSERDTPSGGRRERRPHELVRVARATRSAAERGWRRGRAGWRRTPRSSRSGTTPARGR